MSGSEIVGYLLAEQPFCSDCIHDLFIPFDLIAEPDRITEDILNLIAGQRGIDRDNENSFSTYRFPKPIYAADLSGAEVCIYCGKSLNGRGDLAP